MKAFLLLLIATIFMSCGDTMIVERLDNHGIYKVKDFKKRDFKEGDTICIQERDFYYEDHDHVSDGVWKDTIITAWSYDSTFYIWEYYMAVVIKE
jgi:hypothetical protein